MRGEKSRHSKQAKATQTSGQLKLNLASVQIYLFYFLPLQPLLITWFLTWLGSFSSSKDKTSVGDTGEDAIKITCNLNGDLDLVAKNCHLMNQMIISIFDQWLVANQKTENLYCGQIT